MKALVGYTGFVGSNICQAAGEELCALYHSKNIQEAYGTSPELLIYSGVRAEKYLANHSPEQDMALIRTAEDNIARIQPKKLVLISTIDVFKVPKDVDETTPIDTDQLQTYGYDRYQLEVWVREHYPDALIVRLPGLFGDNIKKNFIYDYIQYIPYMLRAEKLQELTERDHTIPDYYEDQGNGFYRVKTLSAEENERLKLVFEQVGFSALNFTDSRSRYQFYNLRHLWKDINLALKADIRLLHLATEPVTAAEVYHYLSGKVFQNTLEGAPASYDYKTVYSDVFHGKDGYISTKEDVLRQIKAFVEEKIGK